MNDAAKRYHHGDLRAALLRAVDEVVRERGAVAVSLREVARRAGVSHGAPAHHFPSKRALLAAYAAGAFRELAAALREELAAVVSGDARDLLAASGRGYVAFARANPARFDTMFRRDLYDPDDKELRDAMREAWHALRDPVRAAAAQGRIPDADVPLICATAWSMVHGLADLGALGVLGAQFGGADLVDEATTWFARQALSPRC